MTEMPDLGAFPEGGTFINDGALVLPILKAAIPVSLAPLRLLLVQFL
jgi:hypothetical protein